jgi:hypothetical protein
MKLNPCFSLGLILLMTTLAYGHPGPPGHLHSDDVGAYSLAFFLAMVLVCVIWRLGGPKHR